MNVKLLKNLAFLGLLSFSVFPSFALSKIIPDGTIPYNMGVQLKGDTDGPEDLDRVQELFGNLSNEKKVFMILVSMIVL